jgi:hypothetical protein
VRDGLILLLALQEVDELMAGNATRHSQRHPFHQTQECCLFLGSHFDPGRDGLEGEIVSSIAPVIPSLDLHPLSIINNQIKVQVMQPSKSEVPRAEGRDEVNAHSQRATQRD